nr:unnamed protein product [Callosobruchus analis]
MVAKIINACAVLHNLCNRNQTPAPAEYILVEANREVTVQAQGMLADANEALLLERGQQQRATIIQRLWHARAIALKRCTVDLTPILCKLFKVSYEQGVFLATWKIGCMHLIPNKGRKPIPPIIDLRLFLTSRLRQLLLLYKKQIRPSLDYCSHVWGCAPKHSLKLLDAI